jgi:hypothetical protein
MAKDVALTVAPYAMMGHFARGGTMAGLASAGLKFGLRALPVVGTGLLVADLITGGKISGGIVNMVLGTKNEGSSQGASRTASGMTMTEGEIGSTASIYNMAALRSPEEIQKELDSREHLSFMEALSMRPFGAVRAFPFADHSKGLNAELKSKNVGS